jgi:hypothetical protein
MDLLLHWFRFYNDRRYSWRFKLANFIMDDALRTKLESQCMTKLSGFRYINAKTENEKIMQQWAEDALDYLAEILEA